jgi:hypothetical protein
MAALMIGGGEISAERAVVLWTVVCLLALGPVGLAALHALQSSCWGK